MGPVQLVAAVRLLLEPRLLFGRVIVPETGRLRFGDKFYVTDEDERLEYGPGEKGEVLQPEWGSRTPRNGPFPSANISWANSQRVVGGGWQVVGGGWWWRWGTIVTLGWGVPKGQLGSTCQAQLQPQACLPYNTASRELGWDSEWGCASPLCLNRLSLRPSSGPKCSLLSLPAPKRTVWPLLPCHAACELAALTSGRASEHSRGLPHPLYRIITPQKDNHPKKG